MSVTSANRLELLGQRLARGAGERGVVEDARFANRLHLGLVVNERHADHVFVGAQLSRRLHECPVAAGGVEGVDKRARRQLDDDVIGDYPRAIHLNDVHGSNVGIDHAESLGKLAEAARDVRQVDADEV